MKKIFIISTILMLLPVWMGCQSIGSNTPVQPDIDSYQPAFSNTNSNPDSSSADRHLWLYDLIFFDPANPVPVIIPLRNVTGHWNVLQWLEKGPCTNCLKLTGITPSGNGTVLVDVEISHPFSSATFTGFDVRGIAIFAGSHAFSVSGLSASDRNLGDGELVNADGYTSLYNWTTSGGGPGGLQGYIKGKLATIAAPDALVNGYIRYISDDASNIRNAFLAADTITKTFEIDMPDTAFVMGYAVDASWVKPSITPVTDPMIQFPPEANCQEPWKIDVLTDPIGAGFSHIGGSVKLTINVFDRQGKDSHKEPIIECTDLFDGPLSAVWLSNSPGMSTWEATLVNQKMANDGIFKCLVSVEDNENDASPYYLDLTAYQILNFDIPPPRDPVSLAIVDPVTQKLHQDIHFQDNGSYDPDGGAITDYNWDVTGDNYPDFTGTDVYRRFGIPGNYQANLMVIDDQGKTGNLDPKIDFDIVNSGYGINDGNASTETNSTDIAIDSNGYVYICGYFGGTDVDFDPGYGEDLHTSIGGYDCFLSCFNSIGNHQWTQTWGGTEGDVAVSVCIDNNGFVYVGGYFTDTVDFDPGWDSDYGTAEDEQDAFLVKYDVSGNYLWKRNWGGERWESVTEVSAIADYVAVSGYFDWDCDFDPGSGTDKKNASALDGYLSLFEDDGTWKWVVVIGQSYNDEAQSCAMSPTNNIFIAGKIGNSISPWNSDGFLNRYDLAGNLVWTKRWASTSWVGVLDVTVDSLDNPYLCGEFSGTCDFDPGTGEESYDADGNDAYISSFNFGGDHLWTAIFSGTSDFERAYCIVAGNDGAVYTCGTFSETVDLDHGSGIDQFTSNGSTDFFLAKYTSDGTYTWGRAWGDTGYDVAMSVAVQNNGNTYMVGKFTGTIDFDPGSGVCERTSAYGSDMFLLKCFSNGYW